MQVTLIGAGRLGAALARRSLAQGHRTRILTRNTPLPADIAAHPLSSEQSCTAAVADTADDLVILAAPSVNDGAAEALVDRYLESVPVSTPVASAVGYAGAPHSRWGNGRAYVRFLATPAVANPVAQALFILDGDAMEWPALCRWFGPATLAAGSGDAFVRHVRLLMATPLHLGLLSHLLAQIDIDPRLASAPLSEAAILLGLAGDPATAVDLCATPGGLTERLIACLAPLLHTLDEETGNDGRL